MGHWSSLREWLRTRFHQNGQEDKQRSRRCRQYTSLALYYGYFIACDLLDGPSHWACADTTLEGASCVMVKCWTDLRASSQGTDSGSTCYLGIQYCGEGRSTRQTTGETIERPRRAEQATFLCFLSNGSNMNNDCRFSLISIGFRG